MIWTEDNRDPLWKDFLFFPPWTILIRSIKLCVHNWTEKRETFRWGKVDRTILTSRENEADACVIPPRQYPWTDQWVLSTVVRSTEVFFYFLFLIVVVAFLFFFFFCLKGGEKKVREIEEWKAENWPRYFQKFDFLFFFFQFKCFGVGGGQLSS